MYPGLPPRQRRLFFASGALPISLANAKDVTAPIDAPSDICDALPAVIVPNSLNAGNSLETLSRLLSPLTPSSLLNASIFQLYRDDFSTKQSLLIGLRS